MSTDLNDDILNEEMPSRVRIEGNCVKYFNAEQNQAHLVIQATNENDEHKLVLQTELGKGKRSQVHKIKELNFGSADGDNINLEDFAAIGKHIFLGKEAAKISRELRDDPELIWNHPKTGKEFGIISFEENATEIKNAFFKFSNRINTPELLINSDIKFKKEVRPLKNCLSRLLKVNGYIYKTKQSNLSDKIGLIAQDIEKQFPETVEKINDYKSVRYYSIVPILIESIKELSLKINLLERELKDKK
tara:strand:+ start:35 stop:775 length:741 start_codon:yes stop_codon:yes gene_type:complete